MQPGLKSNCQNVWLFEPQRVDRAVDQQRREVAELPATLRAVSSELLVSTSMPREDFARRVPSCAVTEGPFAGSALSTGTALEPPSACSATLLVDLDLRPYRQRRGWRSNDASRVSAMARSAAARRAPVFTSCRRAPFTRPPFDLFILLPPELRAEVTALLSPRDIVRSLGVSKRWCNFLLDALSHDQANSITQIFLDRAICPGLAKRQSVRKLYESLKVQRLALLGGTFDGAWISYWSALIPHKNSLGPQPASYVTLRLSKSLSEKTRVVKRVNSNWSRANGTDNILRSVLPAFSAVIKIELDSHQHLTDVILNVVFRETLPRHAWLWPQLQEFVLRGSGKEYNLQSALADIGASG